MLTSSAAEPMRHWERMVLAALHTGTESYVVLRSELLFATSVLLLVRETMLPHVRNVEAASKKTGLRGMSGNKGGIAVRMDVFDTDLCVVGAHLAAGSTSVDERNGDYASIARGVQFPRGRTIDAHTHVFWAGDLNYRFDQLSSAEVRGLCAELPPVGAPEGTAPEGVLRKLHAHDQLKLAQASQAAFAGYLEGPLTFRPTYKYDIHTDTYDSSEKARAPAWTDRVLWRTKMHDADAVRLTTYTCADLRISDHRPVHAQFDVLVYAVDATKRAALQKELVGVAQQSAPPSDDSASLPQPSDDAQQWWHQGPPLQPSTDATPGNPFVETPPSLPARRGDAAAPALPPPPPRRSTGVIDAENPTGSQTRAHVPNLSARGGENPAAPPPVPRRPDFT
ncbi:phosphoinositide 5-phosphatase [Malassezia furfur]|uniref:Phosphoinositide 5-phosphatase n=1 Tax=Malassezia furfur TaxID=55194 RepID=A0ABY8EP99_MALFU|nr:phosphoinositide 5-phosphatase [Malassezia furfur]